VGRILECKLDILLDHREGREGFSTLLFEFFDVDVGVAVMVEIDDDVVRDVVNSVVVDCFIDRVIIINNCRW